MNREFIRTRTNTITNAAIVKRTTHVKRMQGSYEYWKEDKNIFRMLMKKI